MTRAQLGRRDVLRGAASLLAACWLPRFARAAEATLRAQRLAWAGVRLQLENATLFLDPLISADVWGPALKDTLVPVDVAEGARFVLITHRHPDHFDVAAVKKALGDTGTLVCAPDAAAAAAGRGLRVRPAPLYEPTLLGDDFTVTAVPAADGYGDPQVSWVVSGGGRGMGRGRIVPGHIGVLPGEAPGNALHYLGRLRERVLAGRSDAGAIRGIAIEDCLAAGVAPTPFEREWHGKNLDVILERRLLTVQAW